MPEPLPSRKNSRELELITIFVKKKTKIYCVKLLSKKVVLIFSSLFLSAVLMAQQNEIKGMVLDAKTSDPLPFVNIGVKGQSRGTFSDSNGAYRLELIRGNYTLFFSMVGYDRLEKEIIIDGKKELILNISLNPTSQELNTVVVSGSKYAQKIQESISSIEVLKAKSIEISNIPTVDKAVDRIPGVAIVDNEPQIRGGSGFSSGLGSRVMIMVDEIPLLRGDAGRPNWDLLPIDDIDQIEVVKGASSVVYGSSAINGAINVRTAWPKENPETKVNSYVGMYSKPSRIYDTPWSGINPMVYGLTITHSHIFDNNDLSGGISYINDQGYISGVPENKISDPAAFNGGPFNKRLKAYFNARVRSKKIEGLSYGLNGTFYYSENAQTYFWYDADTNLYRSHDLALSLFKEFSFYMDPFIKYFGKKGSSHALKNRVFYTNSDGSNNQSSLQVTVYNEYQFTHKFQKVKDMTLVAGITNIYSYAFGKVFSGQLSVTDSTPTVGENGTYSAENLAIYAQIEKKFFDRLTILFGGRYEYYHIVDLTESKPIFRAGINLKAARGTYLRASVGQGYRVPSIGERYITTNSGNYGFYPNPSLISETSISYELGFKQLFKVGKFAGMADLAGFYEDYQHYVELNFGSYGKSNIPSKNYGFKFFNTGPARIYGADFTIAGEGKIVKNLDLSIMFGYTYSIPQSTDPTYVYYRDKKYNYTYVLTSSDTKNNILKYRIQSLFKGDIQLTWKKFSSGFGGRYFGNMQNIDQFFIDFLDDPNYGNPTGLKKYRQDHHTGTFILDYRLAYLFHDFRFSFIINNLLNTEYSLRPLTIEAPRMTQLQVIYKI